MRTIVYNLNNSEKIIKETIKVLKSGGLVIFPSDTVYGALVDATNPAAVKKLIAFKSRPPGKPISVFVKDFEALSSAVKVDRIQEKILRDLLPGPFTVILDSIHRVNRLLESEKRTLGVRIPAHTLVNKLCDRFNRPITATSANKSGHSPHYSVATLLKDLSVKQKGVVDLIVDAGILPRNKPSTVVDLTQPKIKILRKGDKGIGLKEKFISKSPEETKAIAKKIFIKYFSAGKRNRPLVFVIEGELGVGKTIFVKGIGETLGIENIISPTFVVYYEYGNFYHFDLYQIQEKEEFRNLRIEKLLLPGNILCFEWGEKAGEIHRLLKEKSKIVYIKMKYINEQERKIEVGD